MFDQHHLAQIGFEGFERLLDPDSLTAPTTSGVYVVLLDPTDPSEFLVRSVGGHFKLKDPTVQLGALKAKDVPGCATVYVGRANNLKQRLGLLARFGRGEPVAHWGGRYLWQLANHNDLRVAWRPEAVPVLAEADLLDDFEAAYGQLPFANLVRGSRQIAAA